MLRGMTVEHDSSMSGHKPPPSVTPQELAYMRAKVKMELRRRMRGLRRTLPPEVAEARSLAVAERVQQLPAFQKARTVAGYVAIRREVDPAPILRAAEQAGKRVALPRVLPEEGTLEMHAWKEGEALEPSGYTIPEPLADAPVVPLEEIDLILIPALAVDPRRHRIGYGAGHYDRLLPRMPDAFRVALAYDFQVIAEVPDEPHDVPLSLVVTDREVYGR